MDSLVIDNYFSLECYYTVFPQLFLPQEVDRILYLDVDTIVDNNIWDFYNQDFENNYLIACGQRYQFEKATITNKPDQYGYFNSGVILYNIEKMRHEVTLENYSYIFRNSSQFIYTQRILNWLFYLDTKYEDTYRYNFRPYLCLNKQKNEYAVSLSEKREVAIYHYTSDGTPYKPWDFWIEDDSFWDAFESSPYEEGYFYISKKVNDILSIWWEYAKNTPFYEELYTAMTSKREYILRFSLYNAININRKNFLNLKQSLRNLEQSLGALEQRKSSIKDIQKQGLKTYLQAVNTYWDINDDSDNMLSNLNDVESYFVEYRKRDNLLMIISGKDSCSTYFQMFMDKAKYVFSAPKYREAFVSILSNHDVVYNMTGKNEIRESFDYGKDSVTFNRMDEGGFDIDICAQHRLIVTSKGYDNKMHNSLSEIIVNNINYSMNLRGLNIVVIDVVKSSVVDAFNIETHADSKLHINRYL